MKKEKKLKEAEFFLEEMRGVQEEYEKVEWYLSAFVNSARSVLQYAYEELKHIPENKRWYEECVGANKIIRFFKDKRDINIHSSPVRIDSRSVTVHMPMMYMVVGQGEVPTKKESPPARSETVSKLTNWDGSEEDVFSACEKYLAEIRALLETGQQKGYLG